MLFCAAAHVLILLIREVLKMKENRKNNLVGSILLALCAVIWGSSFVSQSTGAEYVGPFTFMGLRSFLGSATLLPVIIIKDAVLKKRGKYVGMKTKKERLFFAKGALACGASLCVASCLQQIGIDKGTPSGKAGFITAFYILLVPIFSVALKKKIRPIIWPCAAAALVGLYLLCVNDSSVQSSDAYVLACAFCFTVQILIVDAVSPKVDGIKLSCCQFFVVGVLCLAPMFIFEEVTLESIKAAAPSIAYSGIMSSGIAYTLQILGQKRTEPTVASMLMSLESVFALITGMIILHEIPSARELVGCVVMFAAIIAAQLPERKKAESPA